MMTRPTVLHSCRFSRSRSVERTRQGSITVWAVFALLLAVLCTALVVNAVWISSVRASAQHCLDASVLAAADAMLSDDLLRVRQYPVENEWRRERGREAAVRMASRYQRLHDVPALAPGAVSFHFEDASSSLPRAVRAAFGKNTPTSVPLFLSAISGVSSASLHVTSEAVMRHRPAALRPHTEASIPLLPLCLLDGAGASGTSWTLQIERAQGPDRLSWNQEAGTVDPGPDGIPELTVLVDWHDDSCEPVLLPLHCGRQPSADVLRLQFANGITEDDLAAIGQSELRFPATCNSIQNLQCDAQALFAAVIGRPRIICLGKQTSASGEDAADTQSEGVELLRPVAARVMRVWRQADGNIAVTLQPCILSTVTAVMESDAPENRYIYDIRLQI